MAWPLLALTAAGVGFVLLLVFLLVWLAVLGLGFLTGKTFGDLLLRPPTRAEQDAYRNSP